MKRIAALVLILCLIFTFAACGTTGDKKDEGRDADISASTDATGQKTDTVQGDTGNPEVQEDNRHYTALWLSGFAFAGNDTVIEDAFEDVTPMYNLPDGHEFKIKVNLKDGFFLHSVNECFGIFTDRECTNEVMLEMEYDDSTGYVTIAPSLKNIMVNSFPREGIETGYLSSGDFYLDTRTWGGLKTYYLAIKIDTNAEALEFLDKPMRMMFTIAADVDSPTVKVKTNNEGNVTLYWDQVKGTEYYKVYSGSRFRMRELGRTDKTEFVLDEGDGFRMKSLLAGLNDFAVVAVKGEKESRLSNIIKGEDYAKTAPLSISLHESYDFSADEVTIMDMPRDIDVEMADYSTVRTYPVIWDFRNPEETGYGYAFYGKVPGTTLRVRYRCLKDEVPTEEEI